MTRKEIVNTVYNRTTLKKKEASVALDAIISTIISSLACGEKVEIRGFCRFTVRERNSFISWNPKSGQKVKVPSKKLPYFRAGKDLKEIVDYEKTGSIGLTI
tara:strand:- start:266 stop:571 length:306 start_codon:yes stop_codon:yes gene_type:complete